MKKTKNYKLNKYNEENIEINQYQNNSLNSEGNIISLADENTTSFRGDNLSSRKNENYLYGNDFSLNEKPLKMGNTRVCFFIQNYPIISIGKNILIPLLLILFICLIYLFIWNYFLNISGNILKKVFNYFFLGYLISHVFSIFLNPGIPSFKYNKIIKKKLSKNKINELDVSSCLTCNLTYKMKDKINHCKICNICYYEQDHHCIWIGHCIGKYNRIFFGIFVFTLLFFIIICLAMIFIKIIKVFSS